MGKVQDQKHSPFFSVTINKMETSQLMNCRLPSWKLDLKRKWPNPLPTLLMSCMSSKPRSSVAGTSLQWNSRIMSSLQTSLGSWSSCSGSQVSLLTDAQLVSDGLSSPMPNGVGIKMKVGGSFMYLPSLRSSSLLWNISNIKPLYYYLHSVHLRLSSE